MSNLAALRQDPIEAILVIIGHSFLNFFVWKVLENKKNDTTFVRMRSSDPLGDKHARINAFILSMGYKK